MLRLVLTTVRGNARRMVSAGLAIMLGVAFLATTLLLSASMQATMEHRIAGALGGYAAVAAPGDDSAREPVLLPVPDVDAIRSAPGVTGVEALRTEPFLIEAGGGGAFVLARSSGAVPLLSGRMPQAPGEIALDGTALSARNLQIGSEFTLRATTAGERASSVRVVGVIGVDPREANTGVPTAVAPTASIAAWSGREGFSEVRISGADPVAVRDAVAPVVSAATGRAWQVQTGADRVAALVAAAGAQTALLATVLLTFTAVALFVCALVIANTFTIVLAQRARQLALLRCVGADRRQVFTATLLEALLVGVVASVVGVGVAVAAAAGLASLPVASELGFDSLAVTPTALGVPVLAGVALTALASIVPAQRATRVAPLAALRPDLDPASGRVGRVRIGVGVALAGVGAALLVLGATTGAVEFGIPGGMLSFIGVLVLGPVIVPAVVALLRRPAGWIFGDPGRLAVDNARRNPARAAATSSALLVGVTLITMMLVGAATGRTVATAEIDQRYPLDVAVSTTAPGGVPAATIEALRAVPGVGEVGAVPAGGNGSVLTPAHGSERTIGVRFAPDAAPDATLESVNRIAAQVPSAQISGAAAARAEFDRSIDIVLAIVVALLAVSVVIALVGVGNTLGLSVLERTRESALLRALGLTRGQLRGTLAVEALLLAGVGIGVGVVLGVLYGWAGAAAIFGAVTDSVPLAVPWDRVALAAAVALAAGVLASVIPARRASRITPAQGLGAD